MEYIDELDFFNLNYYESEDGNTIKKINNRRKENDGKPIIPTEPFVMVQFRTASIEDNAGSLSSLDYDLSKDSKWETVSFRKLEEGETSKNFYDSLKNDKLKFDNYFENLTLEDGGGLINCSLSLYDPSFSRLEGIITRSIMSMKIAKAAHNAANSNQNLEETSFQCDVGAPQDINFRIKFGYTDPILDTDSVIKPDHMSDTDWKSRAKNRTNGVKLVIQSPWLYFQMMGCKFIMTQGGLKADINGISIGTNFFDRLKIIRRFAVLKGSPRMIVRNLGVELFSASEGKIQFINEEGKIITPADVDNEYSLERFKKLLPKEDEEIKKSEVGVSWTVLSSEQLKELYKNFNQAKESEFDKYQIEIQLGGEPRNKVDKDGKVTEEILIEYMTVRQLLNDMCGKVPPIFKYKKRDGSIVYIENGDNIRKIFESKTDNVELEAEDNFEKGTYVKSELIAVPYTYSVEEVEIPENDGLQRIVRVRFYYRKYDPSLNQEFMRRYTWRNYSNTLIKSFGINSNMDFVAMNQPLAVLSEDNLKLVIQQNSGTIDDNQSTMSSILEAGNNVKGIQLVKSTMESKQNSDDDPKSQNITSCILSQQMVQNLNNQVFKGVIEIPGDPFYIFSDDVSPYQYGVYIRVLRDLSLYNHEEQELKESYMTGLYLISKITHNISVNGFNTNLELSKFPS